MKKTLKKFALIAGLVATVGGTAVASAAVQYKGGGVWTYGAGYGGAYSNYYHGSR